MTYVPEIERLYALAEEFERLQMPRRDLVRRPTPMRRVRREGSCGQARKIPAKWTKTFWSSERRLMDFDRRLHKVIPEQCLGAAKERRRCGLLWMTACLKDALDTPGLVGHRAGEQALNLT